MWKIRSLHQTSANIQKTVELPGHVHPHLYYIKTVVVSSKGLPEWTIPISRGSCLSPDPNNLGFVSRCSHCFTLPTHRSPPQTGSLRADSHRACPLRVSLLTGYLSSGHIQVLVIAPMPPAKETRWPKNGQTQTGSQLLQQGCDISQKGSGWTSLPCYL